LTFQWFLYYTAGIPAAQSFTGFVNDVPLAEVKAILATETRSGAPTSSLGTFSALKTTPTAPRAAWVANQLPCRPDVRDIRSSCARSPRDASRSISTAVKNHDDVRLVRRRHGRT